MNENKEYIDYILTAYIKRLYPKYVTGPNLLNILTRIGTLEVSHKLLTKESSLKKVGGLLDESTSLENFYALIKALNFNIAYDSVAYYDIAEVNWALTLTRLINRSDLQTCKIVAREGKELNISKDLINEFTFTGLSNRDFPMFLESEMEEFNQ